MSKQMSTTKQIPAGWKVVPFEKCLDTKKSKKLRGLKKKQYKKRGKYPIIDQGNSFISGYTNNQETIYKFDSPIILFGDHTRILKYIDFSFAIGADGTKIFQIQPDIDSKFFYYYLLNTKIPNTGYNRHYKFLKELDISIPPLPEQTRIAEILSKVDSEIEKTDQIIEQTEKLKRGLMQKLLNKGIGHTKFKKTELGEIPEEWEVVRLGDICDFTTGKLNSNKAVSNGKYPFFTCSQETFAIDSYSFDQEAILLAGNNAAGVYSVKHYKGKFDAYQRTYVITVKRGQDLDYIFLKEILQAKLEDLKNASFGSTTKFLTVKLLKNLLVKLPPIKEKAQIVKILSKVDSKIQINQKLKSHLQKLKKGLMNDLLSGRVRTFIN